MDLSAGHMLSDNLQLEREIGSGGMGSVWVARHAALGNAVAVKILHRVTGPTASEQRARFQQEARGLAQLDHPHLVKLFDFGMTPDGDLFIAMELLRGEDLGQRLKRAGPLTLADTSTLVAQVCSALSCVHAAGVIHRDIKPPNIFLLEAAGGFFVKVVDFGVAKFTSASMALTTAGTVIGTPYYMSPEHFMRPSSIDGRSDLWSVAVVVYACLTGELPFTGDSLAAVGMAVAVGKFEPLGTRRSELPAAVDQWMKRALHADPDRRYQSAKELADAFASAVSSISTASSSSTAGSASTASHAGLVPTRRAAGPTLVAPVAQAPPPAIVSVPVRHAADAFAPTARSPAIASSPHRLCRPRAGPRHGSPSVQALWVRRLRRASCSTSQVERLRRTHRLPAPPRQRKTARSICHNGRSVRSMIAPCAKPRRSSQPWSSSLCPTAPCGRTAASRRMVA